MANEYLYVAETVSSIRSKIIGYLQAGGSTLSNWIAGGIGQQIVEAVSNATQGFTGIAARASRGFGSLEFSTDPGDEDPYDPVQATLAPRPGYLSDFGSNVFGTDRLGDTFATGSVSFINTGPGNVNQSLAPYTITVQSAVANPDGSHSTYRNSSAISSLAGTTVPVDITADIVGITGNASTGDVNVLVSVLPGVTVTNPADVTGGGGREGAGPYRDRCRIAPASVSPNGPADAYRYIALGAQKNATTGAVFYFPISGNGTGLGADSDGNLVAIPNAVGQSLGVTRVYVSKDSATGLVLVYFATASGAAGGGVVTDLAMLFDAAYWPDATTRSFNAATPHSVTVTSTSIKARAGAGVSAAGVAAKIGTALSDYFATIPIGGYDQTLGAGTLYLDEIRAVVSRADPAIYHVALSSPGADVALALGEVATLTNNINAGSVTVS